MSRHVVFGTGLGSPVVTQLVDAGEEVVAASRSGDVPTPLVEALDATANWYAEAAVAAGHC